MKKNTPIIVDASIILKILLSEDIHSAKKLSKISSPILSSPILYLECLNIISLKVDSGPVLQSIISELFSLPITISSLKPEDLNIIATMAHENKTTTYDCSYHYLAIRENGVFLTSDTNYYNKSSHLKHIELWN